MFKKILQVLLVLMILGVGVLTAVLLVITRKSPQRKEHEKVAPLVEVEVIKQQDVRMIVEGFATVQAKVEAEVVPQVSGKVVAISENFVNGGFVRGGETLVTIDPRDYELALQSAEAEVARAEVDLDLERAEAEAARRDWEDMNPGKEPPSPLVFHEPQVRQVETKLRAAKAQLAAAQLSLDRTRVSLPFDGRVASEMVDLGQYVNVGQSIGKIYGIDAVEIEVPLEDWELGWFDIPSNPVCMINGKGNSSVGAEVEVQARFAGGEHIWKGRVVRTTGEVDRTSRMVSVVVEVPEPYRGADGRPPLVPGMFVELRIKGRVLEKAISVPRFAIHEGRYVWAVNDGTLHVKELEIVRTDQDYAYVVSGLEDGDLIVTSSLDTVTEGMRVRTEATESDESKDGKMQSVAGRAD